MTSHWITLVSLRKNGIILTYKTLSFICILFNNTGHYTIPHLVNSLTISETFAAVTIIRVPIPIFQKIAYSVLCFYMLVIMQAWFRTAGDLRQNSYELKRHRLKSRSKAVKMEARALQPLIFKVGQFFTIRKFTFFTYVAIICNNTVTILLL